MTTFSNALNIPSVADTAVVGTGTGFSTLGYSSSPIASSLVAWDANSNLFANSNILGFATTPTAAATTVLTVSSAEQQYFTGTTTQTVTLPLESTLTIGQSFIIVNNSTGVVTVQSSGANTIQAMAPSTQLVVTVINTTITTAAAWNAVYSGSGGAGSVSISGDSGSISGSSLTIYANQAALNAGSSVRFTNTGTTSLFSVTDSGFNTILGNSSGNSSMSGTANSGFGYQVLSANTSGYNNLGFGNGSLKANTTGYDNVSLGDLSLNKNTVGVQNVAAGFSSLTALIDGNNNCALGNQAGAALTHGSWNIYAGYQAGITNTTTEASNIYLNHPGVILDSNILRIGAFTGAGGQGLTQAYISGIAGNILSGTPSVVTINTTTNQLGVATFPVSPENLVYVAVSGSDSNPGTFDAPFLTIQAAINSTTASATNPFDIIVAPGTYISVSATNIAPYVNIIGSGINATLLTMDLGLSAAFLSTSGAFATLADFTVTNSQTLDFSTGTNGDNCTLTFNNIIADGNITIANTNDNYVPYLVLNNVTCVGTFLSSGYAILDGYGGAYPTMNLTPASSSGLNRFKDSYINNVSISGLALLTLNTSPSTVSPAFSSLNLSGTGCSAIIDCISYRGITYASGATSAQVTLSTVAASILGGSGFTTINVQSFIAAGTFTYTPTVGMKYCTQQIVGAGGGGGAAQACVGVQSAAGSGGGGGGYANYTLSAAAVGASQVVVVGASGAGGVFGTSVPGDGGLSSVGSARASGGYGGSNGAATSTASYLPGGYGGDGLSGDYLGYGSAGMGALALGSLQINTGGEGGQSIYGGSCLSVTINNAGNQGSYFGGGGGGASVAGTSVTQNGGAGGVGLVIITEYI